MGVGLPREWVDVGLPCQRVGGCGFTESEDGLVGRLVWVYRVRVCGFVWGYRVRGWVGWCGFTESGCVGWCGVTESEGGWVGVGLPSQRVGGLVWVYRVRRWVAWCGFTEVRGLVLPCDSRGRGLLPFCVDMRNERCAWIEANFSQCEILRQTG